MYLLFNFIFNIHCTFRDKQINANTAATCHCPLLSAAVKSVYLCDKYQSCHIRSLPTFHLRQPSATADATTTTVTTRATTTVFITKATLHFSLSSVNGNSVQLHLDDGREQCFGSCERGIEATCLPQHPLQGRGAVSGCPFHPLSILACRTALFMPKGRLMSSSVH